jgi:hypothetical protein
VDNTSTWTVTVTTPPRLGIAGAIAGRVLGAIHPKSTPALHTVARTVVDRGRRGVVPNPLAAE